MRRIVGSILVLALWLVPASAAGAAIDFAKTPLPAGGTPLTVAVGNLDGKRGPDLVTGLYENAVSVRLNHGNGTSARQSSIRPGAPYSRSSLAT